jgi:hypothetical protein
MEIIDGKIVFDTLIGEPGKDLHNEGYVEPEAKADTTTHTSTPTP